MFEERQPDEPFERKGEWWVPDDPCKNRYAGTLRYNPNQGGILDLVVPKLTMPYMPIRCSNVIHGEVIGLASANQYTLAGCRVVSESTHSDRLNSSAIEVEAIYEGSHIDNFDDKVFSSLEVSFRSLVNWVSEHCLSLDRFGDLLKIDSKGQKIDIGKVGEFDNVILRHWVAGPYLGNREVPLEIQERVGFYFKAAKPQSFAYFEFLIDAFEAFFSIATQCWSQSRDVFLAKTVETEEVDRRQYARIHLKRRFNSEPISIMGQESHLFNQSDLRRPLNDVLSDWIAIYPKLRTPINLYLVAFHSDSYMEHEFNMLMQAVESYHRQSCNGFYMDQEIYDQNVYGILAGAIPKELEKDHKSALKSRLKYGNEFSQRKRLKELLRKHKDSVGCVFPIEEAIADQIVEARNLLTHFPSDAKDYPSGPELRRYANILRALLDACFLSEIGFKSEEISELFTRNHYYRPKIRGRYR